MLGKLHTLTRDERGITIVEFAMIAPTLMLMLMATYDLGYRAYITAVLQGEMAKAGRDSGLQNGGTAATSINNRVADRVRPLVQNGNFAFTRTNYPSFTRAGQQEQFTDGNANGSRDPGECFQDENGNGTWDVDSGISGQGSANDIVQYRVTLTYQRLFPMYGLLGWPSTQTISATTVLRNQPYGPQAARPAAVVCT